MAATFDGASGNRRLVTIHDMSARLLFKVPNMHARDGREGFFSDPSHLITLPEICMPMTDMTQTSVVRKGVH